MLDKYLEFYADTFTNKKLYFLNPKPADICIEDIAHSLSNICRYNGHCKKFYSVAQHSIFVSDMLPARLAIYGLLHDATETYVTDIPRPLKKLINGMMDGKLKEIEYNIHHCINSAFNLSDPSEEDVKLVMLADNTTLYVEAPYMMPNHDFKNYMFGDIENKERIEVYDKVKDYYFNMTNSEIQFIRKFNTLTGR